MADNPTVDNGGLTDYVVAADDDGTALHQYTKVEFGADNTQTKVTTTTGLPIQGTAGGTAVPVSVAATVTVDSELPAAAALATDMANPTAPAVGAFNMVYDGSTWDRMPGTSALGVQVQNATAANLKVDPSGVTSPVSGTVTANLAAGTNAIGKLAANSGVDIGDVDVTSLPNVTLAAGTNTNEVVGDVAQDAAIAGNPLSIGLRASDATPSAMSADGDSVFAWADRKGRQVVVAHSATPSQASVAGSASSVTILAANTARAGATIANDSSAVLYLKLGATASTTSFTVAMAANSYYEVPFGYTGIIDGIWASATGSARITELT